MSAIIIVFIIIIIIDIIIVILFSILMGLYTFLVCKTKVDLGFLVDGSGSINRNGKLNFERLLLFVKAMINSFSVCKKRARVGVVLYSTRSRTIFPFGRYCSKAKIFRAINAIRLVCLLSLTRTETMAMAIVKTIVCHLVFPFYMISYLAYELIMILIILLIKNY